MAVPLEIVRFHSYNINCSDSCVNVI